MQLYIISIKCNAVSRAQPSRCCGVTIVQVKRINTSSRVRKNRSVHEIKNGHNDQRGHSWFLYCCKSANPMAEKEKGIRPPSEYPVILRNERQKTPGIYICQGLVFYPIGGVPMSERDIPYGFFLSNSKARFITGSLPAAISACLIMIFSSGGRPRCS